MLVSWIGNADLRAPESGDKADVGPVAQAIGARQFDRALLLADLDPKALRAYEGWLRAGIAGRKKVDLRIDRVELTSSYEFRRNLQRRHVSARSGTAGAR